MSQSRQSQSARRNKTIAGKPPRANRSAAYAKAQNRPKTRSVGKRSELGSVAGSTPRQPLSQRGTRTAKKSVGSKTPIRISGHVRQHGTTRRSPKANRPTGARPMASFWDGRNRISGATGFSVTDTGQIHAMYIALVVLGITAFGLIILLSASSVSGHYEFGDSLALFRKQAIWAGVGLVGFAVCSRIDYTHTRKLVLVGLVVSVVLLTLVLFPGVGVTLKGSSRWLKLGPVVIQPAEIAKLALIIFGAHLLTLRERRMDRPDLTVKPMMLTFGLLALLLYLQPKLGTILVLGFTIVIMLFVAGSRLRHLLPWLGAGAVGLVLAVLQSSYAKDRILAFLDPVANQQGIAFQTYQSQMAAASGGLTGAGLGAGRAKYGFLPEVESDFIFANLAEETGLVGASAVVAAYVLLAWLGLRAAMGAPDRYGMLLATGITCLIVTQAFLNIGVVLGVLPTTGVPLPFISAGGSSLVMMLAAAGLLTNVARRARVSDDTKNR